MFEQINEPVDVAALFSARGGTTFGGKPTLIPKKFKWQGREYPIKTVNLTYSSFEGRIKFYYFAVSDNTSYFKLRFNSQNLSWVLLESYVE